MKRILGLMAICCLLFCACSPAAADSAPDAVIPEPFETEYVTEILPEKTEPSVSEPLPTELLTAETAAIPASELLEIPDVSAVRALLKDTDILMKVRCLYPKYTTADTKTVLLVQADGRVYCGFYTMEEGRISDRNILQTPDGQELESYRLQDDLWLDAVLSETPEDDFTLFAETIELGYLSAKELDLLTDYVLAADPQSSYREERKPSGSSAPAVDLGDIHFSECITWDRNHAPARFCISTSHLLYDYETDDSYAKAALNLLQGTSAFQQWMEVYEEQIGTY